MKKLLEVEFPDDFEFPDTFDSPMGPCDNCPFCVVDTHECEICLLTTPIDVSEHGKYECSYLCPLKDGVEKVCLNKTRRKKMEFEKDAETG